MAISAQQAGRDFEHEFADRYGMRAQAGSGATPRFKLDVTAGIEVVMSLKSTKAQSWRITAADVREMRAGAGGPGSRDQLGILIGRIEGVGVEIAAMEVPNLFALLRGDVSLGLNPSSREQRIAAADPLAYLRSEVA